MKSPPQSNASLQMNAIEIVVFAICTVLLFTFGGSLVKRFGIATWAGVFIVPVGLWLFAAYGILRGTYADIRSALRSGQDHLRRGAP